MKKKILLSVFVIFLVLALIGCIGVIPDLYQEDKVVKTVVNYWSALSNKQYELAKTYCMPCGNAYYAVEDYQSRFDYDYVTLNWILIYNWVEIIRNEAIVNMDINLIVTVCLEDICSNENETLYNYSMYLIKISGDWKLK